MEDRTTTRWAMRQGAPSGRIWRGSPVMATGWLLAVASALTMLAAAACSHPMMHDIEPPPAEEFGYGPRVSADGLYRARVEPLQPIRVGHMHGWTLGVRDAAQAAVEGAEITVDGGMPQHGHGLPTQPRVTRELGGGAYQVEGIRFNMGGWWVVQFRITTPAGTDVVTFNLAL